MRVKALTYIALSAGAVVLGVAGWVALMAAPAIPADALRSPVAQDAQLVAQGAYLAKAGDCAACHTAPGGRPFAGGLALHTPFGTIMSTNITPDPNTGIGRWTEAAFARALRQGISRDGHNLYPAMPYTAYARVSDADVHALKAYVDSLQPVVQPNRANDLSFPFNLRFLLRLWNAMMVDGRPFAPDAGRSPEWNRGAYLVEGLGHCGVCHTAKNLLGGDRGGDRASLQGGLLQGWFAPELSRNAHVGLGQWPSGDLVAYLKTGRAPEAIANGPMVEVVEKSTSQLRDGDLRAMALYLTGRPGSDRQPRAPLAATDEHVARGSALFQRHCAACHGSSGEGVHAMVPRLASSPALRAPEPASLIQTVLHGGRGGTHMPGFADRLSDAQIADLLTFVRNSWGNGAGPVAAGSIRDLRQTAR
jgi:mono/diheme cytochrome c family protein